MDHNYCSHGSHGDACSDMGMESAELAVAEAKEAGEATKRARPLRQSIQASNWGL